MQNKAILFNLNKVVLVKMSKAMRDYVKRWYGSNPNSFYRQISEQIISQQTFNTAVKLTEKQLIAAFELEIQYKDMKISIYDTTETYTASEFLSKLLEKISDSIRRLKVPDKIWKEGTTLAVKAYQFTAFPLISLINKIQDISKIILPKPIYETLSLMLESLIQMIKNIEGFYKIIDSQSGLYLAFVYGVLNGMIEFLAGIVDIVFLIIDFLLSEIVLKSSAENKIFISSLIEILENLAESLVKDPIFIQKQ